LTSDLLIHFTGLCALLLNVLALVVACGITLAVNPLFAGITGRPLPRMNTCLDCCGPPSALW